MIRVEADLIMAFAVLLVLAALLGWVWCMGVFAVAPRQMKRQQAARSAIRPAPARNVIQGTVTEIRVIER